MISKEGRIEICRKIRIIALTVLILTVFEILLGKILNRLIIAPDLGLVLFLAGTGFSITTTVKIQEIRKEK